MLQEIIMQIDNKANKIIGKYPSVIDSSINFQGENNILFCEDNVRLCGSNLIFHGNNSIIYLSSNYNEYNIHISISNDSVFHIGTNNSFNRKIKVILSEHKHCFIGDNCMFSLDILIRNSDAHLIYSCETGNRINATKSVYIGDHVWVGQFVNILKGTQVDSGSIIGAMSVVAGKKISHNTIWGGNPSQLLKEKVFWDKTCVHDFTEEITKSSMNYSEFISNNREGFHDDYWIYNYSENEVVEWSVLEKAFSSGECIDKCKFLTKLNSKKDKNRFVHIFD